MDWQSFLDTDMNTPSRSDYYLAQIALEVRRAFSTHPARWQLKHFLHPVRFVRKLMTEKPLSIKERTVRAKSFFAALVAASRKE